MIQLIYVPPQTDELFYIKPVEQNGPDESRSITVVL